MSRILIVYASSYGQTRKIAEALAADLERSGHTLELTSVVDGTPPPVAGHDAVVLGSRVERGVHARAIVDYIAAQRAALDAVPSYFFSVSMAAAARDRTSAPQDYLEKLFATTRWRPRAAVAIAGGLPYRKYGWFIRFIMKRISQRTGVATDTSRDHEYTDWSQVKQFAARVAADLATPRGDRPEPHVHA